MGNLLVHVIAAIATDAYLTLQMEKATKTL